MELSSLPTKYVQQRVLRSQAFVSCVKNGIEELFLLVELFFLDKFFKCILITIFHCSGDTKNKTPSRALRYGLACIVGRKGSGKSTLFLRLLVRPNIDRIIFISPTFRHQFETLWYRLSTTTSLCLRSSVPRCCSH